MPSMREWAELASQNERLILPSDQPVELAGGTVSVTGRQPSGQARTEPGRRPDQAGQDIPLPRSA
ncbi:MAG TPA: hypothetical protein VHU92_01620 [Streptosporangiaceae bacterium]|jgi:hypothetical protein|nr:hypothetical protein [Streptosporangiaceae bacterium]